MKYLLSSLYALGLILSMSLSHATESMPHCHEHQPQAKTPTSNKIKLSLKKAPSVITAHKAHTIQLQLLKNDKAVTTNELKEVHTQKLHLLVIDQSLTDYHHIHPQEDKNTGSFVFTFTPKNNGAYRIWADVTPLETEQQEFIRTDLGAPVAKQDINKDIKLNSNVGPYQFNLTLDGEPRVGKAIMATIKITKQEQPFTQLEPLMGAFAHLVGFNEDNSSIIHIHPMGKEPSNDEERGGSELMFHMEFKQAGFVKLFAQFKINENDVYVPFGIFVKAS